MIEVDHLHKRYGDVLAVRDLSFSVREGEVVGFLGPNGAGKSTTIRILTAYMPATRGAVRVAGRDVLKDSLEVRRRIGYLPESVPVYTDMRVEEYLRFRAMLKGVPRRAVKKRVEAALERCQCLDMRRRMIAGLSKGYRQRVGLADAIVHDPPILILDEPTSGLDPNQRREVRNLIRGLGEDKTVLLSSHILGEIESVAERVLILRKGDLVADGSCEELIRRHGGADQVRLEARGDRAAISAALLSIPGATKADVRDGEGEFCRYEITFTEHGENREAVLAAAVQAGAQVRELTRPAMGLDEIFRRLTLDDTERPVDAAGEVGAAASSPVVEIGEIGEIGEKEEGA